MDKEEQLTALFARCFAARVPVYKVCAAAGVAPSTLTRWKANPETMRASTLGKMEKALSAIEREKRRRYE